MTWTDDDWPRRDYDGPVERKPWPGWAYLLAAGLIALLALVLWLLEMTGL